MDKPKHNILPCPFCGRNGEFYGDGRPGIGIGCINDDCITSGSYSFKTEEEAVKMWNTRIGMEKYKLLARQSERV